jgi:hypothetical protein
MDNFWITIAVPAKDYGKAFITADAVATHIGGRVIQIDHEPPQGSLIVGDFNEDQLRSEHG